MHLPNIILAVLIPAVTRVDAIIEITGISSVTSKIFPIHHTFAVDGTTTDPEIQGVGSVSYKRFPVGSNFTDFNGNTTDITGISAITFPFRSDGPTQLAGIHRGLVVDNGNAIMFAANVEVAADGELVDVIFTNASKIDKDPSIIVNYNYTKYGLDTEGLVFYNNSVYVSNECESLYKCPASLDRTTVTDGCTPVGGNVNLTYCGGGAESLTMTNSDVVTMTTSESHFITAREEPVEGDDPAFLRLKSLSASNPFDETRLLAYPRGPVYVTECGQELDMGLSELISLDDMGLDGGQLLSLERAYIVGTDTEIVSQCKKNRRPAVVRLNLISTAGATDVSSCSVINATDPICGGKDTFPVSKEVIFEWTEDKPLEGVEVDNYEGMALLTNPAIGADGAIWLMMINDDNDCEDQVGTQFVIMNLDSTEVPFRKLKSNNKEENKKTKKLLKSTNSGKKAKCPKIPKEESNKTKNGVKKSKKQGKIGKGPRARKE